MAKRSRFETLYHLDAVIENKRECVIVVAANTSPMKSAKLWHERLGHSSQKALEQLKSKDMLKNIGDCNFEFCKSCLSGKQKKVSSSLNENKASRILQLVHSDVFGPTLVASLGGSWYYISFIDDYSRKVWIYLMKYKFEVLNKFREFVALVENQIGNRLKQLRTDNGGEFYSTDEQSLISFMKKRE